MVSEVYQPTTRSEEQPESCVYKGPAQCNTETAEPASKDPGSSATPIHMKSFKLPIYLYKYTCNMI